MQLLYLQDGSGMAKSVVAVASVAALPAAPAIAILDHSGYRLYEGLR